MKIRPDICDMRLEYTVDFYCMKSSAARISCRFEFCPEAVVHRCSVAEVYLEPSQVN